MHRVFQSLLALVAVGALLAGPAVAAPSAVVVGNGTPNSCTEAAFDTALSAGTAITFDCGGPKTILFNSAKVISGPMNIDGGNIITLSGNQTTRLFTVNSSGMLSLRSITLDKGNSGAANGGAIANDGWLSLHLVLIQRSQTDANHKGGAIATTGPVSIDDSTLSNNQAGSGGAIYASSSGGQIQLDATSIDLNKALDPAGAGGGIWLGASAGLNATGNQFVQNSAPRAGGAVYLSPGATAAFSPHGLTGTFLFNNTAKDIGGAIFNEAGNLTLQGADFESNHTLTDTLAVGYGGAVADEGAMIVNDTQFRNNQGRFGGAVYVSGKLTNASAALTRTLFYSNTAADFGGGFYAFSLTTTVTIAASAFEFNHASTGGGLARTNANLSISRSSFTSNTAQNGGGLFLQGLPNPDDAGYVEIRDSTVSGNLALSSPSGGVENSALLDLRNVTLKDNQYGLYSLAGATGRLQSSVLDNPGGLNCTGDGTLPISAGHNFATDNTCGLNAAQNDVSGLPVNLGPLSTGPLVITRFHLPLPGSSLINHGDPGCSSADQRYALRLNQCDAGAVEFGGLLPRVYVPLLQK